MALGELCLSCALCCEGSLFRYVRLDETEAARLSAAGLSPRRRRDGSLALPLGCDGLSNRRCRLYDSRPRGCRLFLCTLAQDLEAGRLDLAAALDLVTEARRLVAEVAFALAPAPPFDRTPALQRAHQEGLREGPEPLRRAERFLARHFLGRPEPD